jgi:alpha-tubulin suppressor-like RCC1 family protein
LVTNGDVYSCGDDSNGKIGRGGDSTNPLIVFSLISKIAAGRMSSYLLGMNNSLYSFGDGQSDALGTPNQNSILTPKFLISNITLMGVMSQSVYLYTTTGKLLAFGKNDAFQLGNYTNDINSQRVPAQITVMNEDLINRTIDIFFFSTAKTLSFAVKGIEIFDSMDCRFNLL